MGVLGHAGLLLASDAGPPPVTGVVSLLHFEGTNGSTTFTDESGKTWTVYSSAQISTAQYKFGTASGEFTGGLIYSSTYSDFGFDSGDYTVEGQYRAPSGGSSGDATIFDNRGGGATGIGIYASLISVPGGGLSLANNSAIIGASGTPFTSSTWIHWAVVRISGTVKGYMSGVEVFSVTDSRTYSSSAQCHIGANNAAGQALSGFVDEVRITKGTGVYTGAFTPPTSPFSYP